ncbi:TonB-dependent receptor [Sphingomonas sp. Root710]|uniref:TonB-dependent receptor n=1 Tax=Sphingomonas sp. Root710 TaxID=1736594 RepID=UPI000A7145F0|nr:TonB-dependent receptor [Sphingomonas sp. Root710]
MKRSKPTRRARTRALSLGATALLSGCLFPAVAWAQAGKARNVEDGKIEEIVVTAEKRAEGLQNIPIAITAVSGATLEKATVKDVSDLTQLVPSLQFGTRSTNIFIAVRGIGQAGQDIGSQSGVTVALDGVPLLHHFMMNAAFLDVERVEVLRGPQGTIAGRNATGGAININAKKPTDTTEGDMSFTVGNYSRIGVRGAVNAAISDQVAGRLSFLVDHADGWMKNGFLKRRNDNTELAQLRGQLLLKPSETLSVHALVEYTRDRSDPSFAQILGRADPNRPTFPETPGYAFPRNDIKHLTFYNDMPNQRDLESVRAVLTATAQLGDRATLTSTSGFIKHDIALTNIDVDATPRNEPFAGSFFPLIGINTKQFTQEFTLTTDLGSRADLVAGLFYMHGVSKEPLYFSFNVFPNYLIYLPTEKLDSYAAYAQFRYNLTDKLRVIAGGRYTIDDKSYLMDSTTAGVPLNRTGSGVFKAFTPRFAVDFTPTDQTLVYASVSRGFKSGGFNTLGDPSLPVNVFNPEFVWSYEAGVKATLFDRKLRLGLTGFYSDYSNLQQTVFRQNTTTTVFYPRVENSVTAKIKGVELEGEVAPVAGLKINGALTYLDSKFGYFCNNDPLYPNLPTAANCVGALRDGVALPPGARELTGNHLPQAPKWQYTLSAQYIFPISDTLEITARTDHKGQSRVFFDIYNNPQNSQAAYGLTNFSLSVGSQKKTWSLSGWIRNAFDKRYISSANAGSGVNAAITGSVGVPRMYGATLYTRF